MGMAVGCSFEGGSVYSAATANLTQLETLAEQTSDPLVAALLTIAKGNYYLAGGDDGLARALPCSIASVPLVQSVAESAAAEGNSCSRHDAVRLVSQLR
jgi:hypothetical protein